MISSRLSRGASTGVLALLLSLDASAQEALPTIDVAGESTSAPSASRFRGEPKTAQDGYVAKEAGSATKTDTPLREIPASVNVVPKQVIIDQALTSLVDALENVPGVRSNSNELEGYNFKIRGFDSLYIYRNNLPIPGGGANPSGFDTANIERIEVLKGPASVLYGRAEPGGLIGIVTKEPLDKPRYVIDQQIGSFDHYRTSWDFSTPLPEVPGLAYRVSGAYQNNGSFRKFQGGERVLIAPVISYRPTEWTDFTIDGQFLGQKAQSDIGVPTIGSAPANLPFYRSFQEPNDPRDHIESFNIGYRFRQNLDENWKVTNRFLFAATPTMEKNMVTMFCGYPFCVDSTNMRNLPRIGEYQWVSGRTFATNIDVEGKFTTFGAKHDFLFGLDYVNSLTDYYFADNGGASSIDIYNPIYGTVSPYAYFASVAGVGSKYHSSELQRQKAFYVQDQITALDDKAHLLLGVRYDVADITRGTSSSFGGDLSASADTASAARNHAKSRNDKAWSPRFGLVYDVLPELSVYGSYSRSFGANNGVDSNGVNLGPRRGAQWEVGLKAEPLEGLTATLAFFQITKSGIATRDYTSPDPFAMKLAGLQRSRGIELDVVGRITDRWTVIANYAHIDAKVISDNWRDPLNPFGWFGPSGVYQNHLDNTPRHSGKVFLTYDFGESGLGWRVGGGVTASTHAWGDIQNTFVIPGWARLDGFASYTTLYEGHKVTAQLNLRNITNTRYYTGVDNLLNYYNPPLSALPAPPFTAIGTLRFEW
ncbi:TonB-dependent siderophore receptor [Methylosinus sp. H3A]|uniref:TonB-dependent siderophore receptor n=1 Tax=Methylosinus sp. H3A TaxID=2785786 RepID=UPI0018C207E8|nr:TonB-dependent siderophore receptor [Methylosinus sp. H3A]MBG0810553.1 TonB-dependent siderophore receptor [Methylosinus sp. H3A]